MVIGNGRITGGYALALREDRFPGAQYVHFIHMDPKAIEWNKESSDTTDLALRVEQRVTQEVELCLQASIAAAVGPTLTRWFTNYLSHAKKV